MIAGAGTDESGGYTRRLCSTCIYTVYERTGGTTGNAVAENIPVRERTRVHTGVAVGVCLCYLGGRREHKILVGEMLFVSGGLRFRGASVLQMLRG